MVRREKAIQAGFQFNGDSNVGYKKTRAGNLKLVFDGDQAYLATVPFTRPGAPATLVAKLGEEVVTYLPQDEMLPYAGLVTRLTASLNSTELEVVKNWLSSGIPHAPNYDEAMKLLTAALKAKGSTKLNTVALNEMMELIEYGKFRPNSDAFVRLLSMIPSAQRSRMLTDDILTKLVPSKDWAKFRPSDWVKSHSPTGAVTSNNELVLDDGEAREVIKVTATLAVDFGDLSKAYQDYLKEYDDTASFHDMLSDQQEVLIKDQVEKLSKQFYNDSHTEEQENHITLDYVHWDQNADYTKVTANIYLEIQIQISTTLLLGKIDKLLPAFTQGLSRGY